jgi:hypothetical protein
METQLISLKQNEWAVRIKAPSNVSRIPTHLIFLIDVSESMLDGQKLVNVKRCAQLVLGLLNAEDKISLITFGEAAQLHLKRVPADDAHKASIRAKIDSLQCDGCTNLSAGLGYVREVLEGDTQKAGLLLLTDGHANRGVSNADELRGIPKSLRTSFPHLSICGVAYGVDHNADLMRGIAEDTGGSYNIVNNIEDTAFAFGDALGGLMSCASQNVVVSVPKGSKVHGVYRTVETDDAIEVHIGDVYAGTTTLVLFDYTAETVAVSARGMSLPDYAAWKHTPSAEQLEGRDKEIELTKMRFRATDILKRIPNASSMTPDARAKLDADIEQFKKDIEDEFFNGHAFIGTLRSEAIGFDALLREAMMGPTRGLAATTSQHTAYLGLGRGFSSPAGATRQIRRQIYHGHAAHGAHDPVEEDEPAQPDAAFQNPLQTEISNLLRTASQRPGSP